MSFITRLENAFNRGKISIIRDNPLFAGNHPESPQSPKNNPTKARPGILSSDSEFFSHNPRYRFLFTSKTRYKNLDFKPPFLGILGDNPKKKANISRIQIMAVIPNGYG